MDIVFGTRAEFHKWLMENSAISDGVWLIFGKTGGVKTLTAAEALEEALCFGWIDGQIQSIDEVTYRKYFARRRTSSVWSDKNKALVTELVKKGLMQESGLDAVEVAKKNGMWDKPKEPPITDEQVTMLSELLSEYEPAYSNFQAMSSSVKRTYARAYFSAKTDAGRESRKAWMIDRLNKNLKPM